MPLTVVESRTVVSRVRSMLTPSRMPVVCLVAAALAALYATRIFSLGFYLDDWTVLLESQRVHGRFSWALLKELFHKYPSRPGDDVAIWLCISLLGRSPFLWQAALAASTVAMAGLSALLASNLNALGGGAPRFSAAAVLLTFLVAPWTYGFTAWPMMLPAHAAMLFFLAAAVLTVRALSRGRVSYTAFPCFILSCITYECCYLQFIPLLGLCWVLSPERFRRGHLLRLGLTLVGFCLAQLAADRLKVWLCGSSIGSMSFSPNWLRVTLQSVAGLPHILIDSASSGRVLSKYAFLVLGLLFLASFVGIRVRLRRESGLGVGVQLDGNGIRAAAVAAACMAVLLGGVLLSILTYALVNYGLWGRGVDSRTTMGITPWICLLVGVLAGNSTVKETGWRNWMKVSALCLLIVGLGTASYERMRDWAGAWKMEQQVLKVAPVDRIARLAAPLQDTLIVALVPSDCGGVPVFCAPWDLSAALGVTYPATKCSPRLWIDAVSQNTFQVGRRVWPQSFPGCITTWDGNVLRQSAMDGSNRYEIQFPNNIPVRDLWVWDFYKQQFYPAPANFSIDSQ